MLLLPRLRLAVLCQEIELDPVGRIKSLIDPLHTVSFPGKPQFPIRIPSMFLYTQLEDALGECTMKVQMIGESGTILDESESSRFDFSQLANRIYPVEFAFHLEEFRFPAAGIYWFHVICNHLSLSEQSSIVTDPHPAPRLHILDEG